VDAYSAVVSLHPGRRGMRRVPWRISIFAIWGFGMISMREMGLQVLEDTGIVSEDACGRCWISESRSCEIEFRARLMTVLRVLYIW
jgi:hypothetical protein